MSVNALKWLFLSLKSVRGWGLILIDSGGPC